MRKLLLTPPILALSLLIFSFHAFSQTGVSADAYIKAPPPPASHKKPSARLSQTDLAAEARKFIEQTWAEHIAKCEDSFYLQHRERFDKEVLFEVRGVEYETHSGPIDPVARGILWSGYSIARFALYRTMDNDSKTWSEWRSGRAESFLFQHEKQYGWKTVSVYLPATSCTDVKVMTGQLGEGQMLPDEILNAPMRSTDGEVMTLKEQKGVVLLYLWATWCGPCRMQDPELVKLQDKYRARGLTVIGLDVDPETDKMIRAYRERFGINYPSVKADRDVLLNGLLSISRMGGIPQTFLIKNGKLMKIFKGYNPAIIPHDMENAVEAALSDNGTK